MGNLSKGAKAVAKKAISGLYSREYYRDLRDLFKCVASPYYRFKPSLWSLKTTKIDRRIEISKRWNYAYIRIPKCANSLVITNLDFYLPEESLRKREEPRVVREARRNFYKMRDLEEKKVKRLFDEGFIFSVVRNPYHRVLSAYLDKMSRDEYKVKYGENIKDKGISNLSFLSFCRWLGAGNHYKDPHWIPQSNYINLVGKKKCRLYRRHKKR